jgi:hypothetical protein
MYASSGSSVWYAAGPTPVVGDNSYMSQWVMFGGGETLTGAYRPPSSAAIVGAVTLQFQSDSTATLTLPNGQQIPIVRFWF